VEGLGSVRVDIVYGGMTYTIVDAVDLGFSLDPSEARDLCEVGEKLKAAAANQLSVEHPENPAIPGITNTEFMGPLRRENGQLISKNCVVVSPGRCDRSPCGTGSSARLALLHAKGLINPGEVFIHESITGSRFTCAIDGITKVGNYSSVIPAIAGQAWITGLYQICMDPTDPYQEGFTVADTWMSVV
jgi:proline racemase